MTVTVDAPRRSRGIALLTRSFDVVVAGVVLLLTLPISLVAAAAIKLTSPRRPVLVREVRVGRNGEHFEMLRFRTTSTTPGQVAPDDAAQGPTGTPPRMASRDHQANTLGRVLRTWSIDALPQWWNVLRGDMTVVGPPPGLPSDRRAQSDSDHDAPSGTPGLTGMWRDAPR